MGYKILITGAAGYIGSHFVEALIDSGAFSEGAVLPQLSFLDDLSTGHVEFVNALKAHALQKGFPDPNFYQVNLLDVDGLNKVFASALPDAVLHFAAKISVAESVERPEFYFENNVKGSKNLLTAMKAFGCKRIVFSSTAAVYGKVLDPVLAHHPLLESTAFNPINPYGESKLQMENAIREAHAEWGLNSVIFRYFNAAGASPRGSLGEWHEPETHLIPLLLRAAISDRSLQVYGTDYDTRDGSCVRDYIHVSDLASAHLLGLSKLLKNEVSGSTVFNLGTATGNTVLEVIHAAEKVVGSAIQFEVHPRRAGDSAVLVADSSRARKELGWDPIYSSMENILKTALQWERRT